MRVVLDSQQEALLAQALEDVVVDVRHVAAHQPVEPVDVVTELVQGCDGRQAVLLAQCKVLFARARRYVYDAGALRFADLVPGQDRVLDALLRRQLIERAAVAQANQARARQLLHDLRVAQ